MSSLSPRERVSGMTGGHQTKKCVGPWVPSAVQLCFTSPWGLQTSCWSYFAKKVLTHFFYVPEFKPSIQVLHCSIAASALVS